MAESHKSLAQRQRPVKGMYHPLSKALNGRNHLFSQINTIDYAPLGLRDDRLSSLVGRCPTLLIGGLSALFRKLKHTVNKVSSLRDFLSRILFIRYILFISHSVGIIFGKKICRVTHC
jgi:hypothetical protein